MISRKSNSQKADEAIKAIRYKLSHPDAFAADLTISKKAILITSDMAFSNLKKEKNFDVQFI